ncbi:hypothetical protein ES705_40517 [subsurface metagenome]
MKKTVSVIVRILFIPVFLFILFLLFFTVVEYRPKDRIGLFSALVADTICVDTLYSSLIWNTGYAGLGANMDFFYDGGENVRDTRENMMKNFKAVCSFIASNDSVDFILLQEVDQSSKRSYRINQFYAYDSILGGHQGFPGLNYNAGFVPVPVNAPLGKVKSGIVSYCSLAPIEVNRYAFKGNYSWPKRLFMLKRCFLVNSYPTNNGKELSVINIHNSAYDDGSLKAQQLNLLKEFALEEYEKGNYILFGGDWNQCPYNFKPQYNQPFDTLDLSYLPGDFLENWKKIYSDSVPSNRRIKTPYTKGQTLTTVIDFYIASPNISVVNVKPHDMDFLFSDHQPLLICFILND